MTRDKISPLPGRGCRFYAESRCVYEEMLNPGFNSRWRCRVIVRLEDEYDTFLRQSESFKLEEDTAHRIWEKRLSRFLDAEIVCDDFMPGGESELPGCARAHGDVCLLALPRCQGTCHLYKPKERKQDND